MKNAEMVEMINKIVTEIAELQKEQEELHAEAQFDWGRDDILPSIQKSRELLKQAVGELLWCKVAVEMREDIE